MTDHFHYWQEQANGYIQSFQNTRLIRGHGTDNWKGPIRDGEPVPAWV